MALHIDSSTMAVEAIEEYLAASAMCQAAKKADCGCFGYPATLLLFCIVNAFGCFLSGDTVQIDGRTQKITKGEPFRVLNHGIFGLSLTSAQIKLLEKAYRNALAHSAIIEIGAFITPNSSRPQRSPFTFATNRIQVISLPSFHELVGNAWSKFPMSRIQAWAKQRGRTI